MSTQSHSARTKTMPWRVSQAFVIPVCGTRVFVRCQVLVLPETRRGG